MTATLQTQYRWYRRAPWLLALAAAAISLASHLLLTRPAEAQLSDVRRRLEHSKMAARAARSSLKELPRVERDVEEARRRLESSRALPQHQDLGQFIRDVTAFGEEASLSKLTVQPGVPRRAGELVSEIPVSLNFEGDFLGVYSFLRRAEAMPRLTAMRALSIRSVDPMAGRVEVQLSVALFFTDGY
jgi:Tfp pilus assembly protein PilO